jgi:hypothetical protein
MSRLHYECFTCAHKMSRDLSKDEKDELQRLHVEKTGRKTLFIPDMEFKCAITGKIISQIDPACEEYAGDSFMEDMRKEIANTARKLREELTK